MILLQITYRRKKPKNQVQAKRRRWWRKKGRGSQSYGYFQAGEVGGPVETTSLVARDQRPVRT